MSTFPPDVRFGHLRLVGVFRALIFVLVGMAGLTTTQAQVINVFLIGGQSNADGRATPSDLPADLTSPQTDVPIYYAVSNSNATTIRASTFTTLRPGQSNTSQFGPEITFGRSIADFYEEQGGTIALIKYAVGGTDLATEWKPGGDGTTTGDGVIYRNFQTVVTRGLAALQAANPQATLQISGMIWMHGESDSNANSAQYQTNLTTFINDIRLTYGANLPFVIGELSVNQTGTNDNAGGTDADRETVRAAQEAVSMSVANTGLVNTDSFGLNSDFLHFNASGQQDLGNGFAAQMETLVLPVISSPDTATGVVDQPFSYQIVATNTPSSYDAAGLPSGLSVDPNTGLISGTPVDTGTFSIEVSASNFSGTGTLTLSLTVGEAPIPTPVITSDDTATTTTGQPFNYQIVATNAPTSFGATGLPTGLSINTATGLISGVAVQTGFYFVELSATNMSGNGTLELFLNVDAPLPDAPVINSGLTASIRTGQQSFSYQITASNSPTSFDATGLPPGLGVDITSGLIVGTPTQAGTYNVTISASNAGGTGTATLVVTVTTTALPVVTLLATSPTVTTGTGETGVFNIALSTPLKTDLVVSFTVKGSAVNGTDYVLLNASKTIKAGKTSKTIRIEPLGNGAGSGGKRTVVLTLQPGAGYIVGTISKVKVKIFGQ